MDVDKNDIIQELQDNVADAVSFGEINIALNSISKIEELLSSTQSPADEERLNG